MPHSGVGGVAMHEIASSEFDAQIVSGVVSLNAHGQFHLWPEALYRMLPRGGALTVYYGNSILNFTWVNLSWF